jgi:hypothetical protein
MQVLVEEFTERIGIKVRPEAKALLAAEAARQGVSISTVVRQALAAQHGPLFEGPVTP